MAAGCFLLGACGERHAARVERLALLPPENLTANPSHDWYGHALAAIVSEELIGSPRLDPQAVASIREASAFQATEIVHGYFTERDGQLWLRMVVEDTATNHIVENFRLDGGGDAVLPLAEAVTRRLGVPARDFGTDNPVAIRAFGEALATADAGERASALERALDADPHFAEALLATARALLSRGERERARDLVRAAAENPSHYDEISLARFNIFLASLDQDSTATAQALAQIATATPADWDMAGRTAQAMLGLHRYEEAAAWFGKAVQANPSRTELWNSRAYAQAYAGDIEGARRSLERYRQGDPDSPNVYDSLGEVYFHCRGYSDAVRYFLETCAKAPDFQGSVALVKAARARLMLGDLSGADELFQQYTELRRQAGDPWIDYRAAEWEFTTGRRRQAIDSLGKLALRDGLDADVLISAHAQLSIWALLTGESEAARRHADAAVEIAGRRPVRALALLCRFLAQAPAGAGQWRQRAEQAFPGPAMAALRKQALIYTFLLSRNYKDAGVLLRESWEKATSFDRDEIQVLLGWTLVETGQAGEARSLLAVDPLVQPGTESVFYCLIFPRILYLRAVVAEQAGDQVAAAENYRLFLRYSGDTPAIFGEEEKARKALGDAVSP